MQKSNNETVVPAARASGLVITEIKDEVLVYDEQRHHIHHLNAVATSVWRLCDGERTVRDLAQAAENEEDTVRVALRKLEDVDLLDGPLTNEMRGTQSRRAFLRKAAVAGAVALPTIISISAPQAAAAQSLLASGVSCTDGSQCATGVCTDLGVCL